MRFFQLPAPFLRNQSLRRKGSDKGRFRFISGFLGFQYLTLNGRFQTLETQASQLKNNNNELKTKLSDNKQELEDKEAQHCQSF